MTATTSAVTIEVTRTLDPPPGDALAQFEPAENARAVFEGELRSVLQTKGGLESVLYDDIMKERGIVDEKYADRDWDAAQSGYAALSSQIARSCLGPHPTMSPIPGLCARPGVPTPKSSETAGITANAWTDYTNAGGAEGPAIPAGSAVEVSCKVKGFAVADGDTWWYRIASSPWNGRYYVSADAFYNNGQTSGTLEEMPTVDPNVRSCSSF